MEKRDQKILQRIKDLTLLNNLNSILLTKDDLEEMLQLILKKISIFFQARAGLLMLLEENHDSINVSVNYNFPTNSSHNVLNKYKNLFLNLYQGKLSGEYGIVEKNSPEQVNKMVFLPLALKNTIYGVIILFFSKVKYLETREKQLLKKVSWQIAERIKKSYLFYNMEKRLEKFSTLYHISHSISGKLSAEEILFKALPYLAGMFESQKAWIMLREGDKLISHPPHIGLDSEEITLLEKVAGKQLDVSEAVLGTGQVLLFNNPSHNYSLFTDLGVKVDNILLIPLKMQNVPLGIIYLGNSKKGKFNLLDSQLATSVGTQLAGALASVRLHEKLAQENIELEAANRLKSQFLANISHELRTPMNSIIGYTYCLLEGMDGEINTEQKKDLEKVLNSAENLLGLINDILDLSKIEAGKMSVRLEAFNLNTCIDNVISTLERLAKDKGLPIIKEIPFELPLAVGDPYRVRQILLNLLSNAIKFTEAGLITIKSSIQDDDLMIAVEDTGIGISAQDLPFIFDEFRQVDGSSTRKYGGTGLGLAITKRLLELQNGQIKVESSLGKGTKFTFTLPRERKY